MLAVKFVLPLKTPVMECKPATRLAVLNVACPKLTAFVARELVPSLNVTVPVGLPEAGATAMTVAVKVKV